MIPVPFAGANRLFVLDGAANLPAYQGPITTEGLGEQPGVISCWRLTDVELDKLRESHCIFLSILGEGQPPISLWVADPT